MKWNSIKYLLQGVPHLNLFQISINAYTRAVRERDGRDKSGRSPENFENPATVSRTPLQCCIAAYKICKYTVQFLLLVFVKLLETRILRIVRCIQACLVLGHYVRCRAVSLRNSGSTDVCFKICANKDWKSLKRMSSDSESEVVVAGSSAEDIVQREKVKRSSGW